VRDPSVKLLGVGLVGSRLVRWSLGKFKDDVDRVMVGLVHLVAERVHGEVDHCTQRWIPDWVVLGLVLHGDVPQNGIALTDGNAAVLHRGNVVERVHRQKLWFVLLTLHDVAHLHLTFAAIHG